MYDECIELGQKKGVYRLSLFYGFFFCCIIFGRHSLSGKKKIELSGLLHLWQKYIFFHVDVQYGIAQ